MAKSGYDLIASEYYDAGHQTSRNFDQTTASALKGIPPFGAEGLVLEVGAGRGRAKEFLGLPLRLVVQLDSSKEMFLLAERETGLLHIHADACQIPLIAGQFAAVVGFLVDPFLGLGSLGEAHRMLRAGGTLLLTTPTLEWGAALRARRGIDKMTTRFRVLKEQREEKTVTLPSLLYSKERLIEMLGHCGFSGVEVTEHCLPEEAFPISPDIVAAAESTGKSATTLPILHVIRAKRP